MACGFGSGPSDPLLSCTLIGSASTRRLAKVVKLENFADSPSNRYNRFSRKHMRSRVGSQLQRGRCAGRASRRRAAALPSKGATRHQCGVQVSGRLPPSMEALGQRCLPLYEGEALEKSTPSATYFRVERGVDFRNFQPLQRSRRLIRPLRLQASRCFAPVAAIKTAETAVVAIARPVRASAQFYFQATRLCRWTREESVSEPEVRPPAEPVAFIATRLSALTARCGRLR